MADSGERKAGIRGCLTPVLEKFCTFQLRKQKPVSPARPTSTHILPGLAQEPGRCQWGSSAVSFPLVSTLHLVEGSGFPWVSPGPDTCWGGYPAAERSHSLGRVFGRLPLLPHRWQLTSSLRTQQRCTWSHRMKRALNPYFSQMQSMHWVLRKVVESCNYKSDLPTLLGKSSNVLFHCLFSPVVLFWFFLVFKGYPHQAQWPQSSGMG